MEENLGMGSQEVMVEMNMIEGQGLRDVGEGAIVALRISLLEVKLLISLDREGEA